MALQAVIPCCSHSKVHLAIDFTDLPTNSHSYIPYMPQWGRIPLIGDLQCRCNQYKNDFSIRRTYSSIKTMSCPALIFQIMAHLLQHIKRIHAFGDPSSITSIVIFSSVSFEQWKKLLSNCVKGKCHPTGHFEHPIGYYHIRVSCSLLPSCSCISRLFSLPAIRTCT